MLEIISLLKNLKIYFFLTKNENENKQQAFFSFHIAKNAFLIHNYDIFQNCYNLFISIKNQLTHLLSQKKDKKTIQILSNKWHNSLVGHIGHVSQMFSKYVKPIGPSIASRYLFSSFKKQQKKKNTSDFPLMYKTK